MGKLREIIQSSLPRDIEVRHDLHRHPELGFNEHRTSGVVQGHLAELPVRVVPNLARGTGVLAYLPATADPENARTIALRADMDALPILEETGVSYPSENPGIMHACGHDGHTTILLSAARTLCSWEERPNNVVFVFQPAEEGGAGGKLMCEDGALDGRHFGRRVDAMYGLHGFPWHEVGHVSTRVGPMMASATQIRIVVHGKGAHAAAPHTGIDPILVASHIVTALQSVVSRSIDPVDSGVVTIGRITAGVAHNVIPDHAVMEGTFRALTESVYEMMPQRIEQIAQNVAAAFGASAEVAFGGSYPVTVNHPMPTERFFQVAREALGEAYVAQEPHPFMGGEDFSFYGREVPACFFFLGLRPADQSTHPGLHSPYFDFNDAAIPIGVELMCEMALKG